MEGTRKAKVISNGKYLLLPLGYCRNGSMNMDWDDDSYLYCQRGSSHYIH